MLIALIITGILLTLSLGVSDLLISAMRDVRLLLDKTASWYFAESGIEQALFEVSKNAPGVEKNEKIETADFNYSYAVRAASVQIPENAEDGTKIFNALHLNESVTVPLFSGTDAANAVQKLKIDYYLAPELKNSNELVNENLDIFRWKIFGIARDGKMEVINEFVPMMAGKNSAENSSCVGTDAACWNAAKFYERGENGFNIIERYPIQTFLENHTQNFLVLTNVVNVDMIQGTLSQDSKKKIANIMYRISDMEGRRSLTLPTIKITADGFSGDAVQSLDLEIKRDSFLPVFNYALYRTE